MFLPRYFNVIRCEAVTQKPIHNHVSIKRRRLLGPSREPQLRSSLISARSAASASSPSTPTLRGSKLSFLDDADQIGTAQGFWPNPSTESDKRSVESQAHHVHSSPHHEAGHQKPPPRREVTREDPHQELLALLPRFRPFKRDLSHLKLSSWESSDKSSFFFRPNVPAFRANAGLRKIFDSYLQHLAPLLRKTTALGSNQQADADFNHALLQTFSTHNERELRNYNYDPADVVSWDWILTSGSPHLAIKRCTILAQDLRRQGRNGIPIFVPLQILRAETIDATSLRALIHMIGEMVRATEGVENSPQPRNWDYTSAVLLIIRLVRHARKAAPTSFDDIVLLTQHLLEPKSRLTPDVLQRLSHFYNRLLGLLALPTPVKPIRSVGSQQKAQLSLVRHMLQVEPQIPLNREGYRALVQVQLAHQKTDDERDWAKAKKKSWPPWREDRLGIEATKDYPGQQSRASKILGRMHEAGYDHFAWEKSAGILAGWDTDKSPTIQYRINLKRKAMSWLAGFLSSHDKSTEEYDPDIWAARITATRTTREAWACFLAFKKESAGQAQTSSPYPIYCAIFGKLFARPHAARNSSNLVPGDVKEVFADPVAQKDLIYVESDPPTINELYQIMLESGLKPAGRLLNELLNNATDLSEGIHYIENSYYAETRKDVLLHAEKYDVRFIQSTLSALSNHFLAAYIKFFCQCDADSGSPLILPTSLRAGIGQMPAQLNYVEPLMYGRQMLYASKTTYTPAWNAHLIGINLHLKHDLKQRFHLWESIKSTLDLMKAANAQPDFATFQAVSEFSEKCLLVPSRSSFREQEFVDTCTQLFRTIARFNNNDETSSGVSNSKENLPDPEHILAYIRVLGIAQDYAGLHKMVRWMNQNATLLQDVAAERASGKVTIQRLMIVIRVFLDWCPQELLKYHNVTTASHAQAEDIKLQCEPFGWPTDKRMYDFVNEHQRWLHKVISAILSKGTTVVRSGAGENNE